MKNNRPDDEFSSVNNDEIEEWLKTHPVVDKDFTPANHKSKSGSISSRQNLSTKRGEQRLLVDLHGLRYEEAERVIKSTMSRAERSGCIAVIFVHGKGYHSSSEDGPVLKSLVRGLLENELALHVKDFYDAPPDMGGSGATIAWLK